MLSSFTPYAGLDMRSDRLTRTLRSTAFRLAAASTSLFIASYVVVFAITFWVASNALETQRRGAIEQELATMEIRFTHGGLSELKQAIREEKDAVSGFPIFVLLQTITGSTFGNIPPLKVTMGWNDYPDADISTSPLEDHDERILTGFAKKLGDGSILLVGFDRFNIIETQEAIVSAFGWSAFVMLFFAIGGGVFIGRRAFYRIDVFNEQLHAFGEGQLSNRLSVNGNGDELDDLAKGVNDTLERVEKLMASLKQVSSDIAHDLRTPLARLRQRLEEASLDTISREDFALVLDDARERVDDILSTFTALLGIAQIESGTLRKKFTSINLSELCQSVVEAYRAAFENEGRHINVAINSGVKIHGERNLITQVLANLLENVLRHTSTGTSMSLRLFTEGQTAILKIKDNGPGIPEAEKEKIFQRFYRLERSRTSPGNGLGLSLVKAVVDLHSADIRLDALSSGLETTIQFPALSIATP